ncbi:hypothetical protein Tco_1099605 [Tanacetum coccineum]
MHNNIMAVGSKDRPPMLATGRYAQWQSRSLRYIDTRPNAILERRVVETILTMSLENKAHCESKKEAIHLLLFEIGDEIYSTVDACKTSHEIWIAIERLQQESYYFKFYKMMNEMIRNNLTVAMMQINVQFLQQLQPEWSRFVTIVKQQHDLDTVSYHKLFDVLKQYQKEVNEICAERIAKNAKPLALVVAAQQYPDPYYQAPKCHKFFAPPSKQASSTRSNASTKFKGKETAKSKRLPNQTHHHLTQVYKPTNNNLRTSSNSRNKNVDTSPRYKNDNQTRQFGNQRTVIVAGARDTVGRKPKRVKDSTYHKEKMLLCKQAEKGVTLQAEQSDWLADTNEEINE